MDKKNLSLGILFIIAAFATLIIGSKTQPAPIAAPAPATATAPDGSPAPASTTLAAPSVSSSTLAALADDRADATTTTLANEFVTVRLTNFGGAIQDVAFAKYPAERGGDQPFVFNQRHVAPMLAIAELSGLGADTRYELVSATASEVVYRTVFENRLEITRRYALAGADGDPYRIRHETTLRNITPATIQPPRLALELGTTTLVGPSDAGLYLNVASYDGEKAHVTERSDLEGGGFLSAIGLRSNPPRAVLEVTTPAVWAAVKNQFFASIYTPDTAGQSVAVRNVELPPLPGSSRTNTGITAAARFGLAPLAPGASLVHGGHFYVGPKEYTRLAKFDHREDKVMQFDRYFFNRIFLSGIFAPLLNKLMVWTHDFVGNWGMAIVLMTILLKVVTLPLTLAASKSAKRMGKLTEPMKAIREKYKDNPKKQQEATLALFKEHKVNPAGGCIPILITMPLFIGFFAMLMGTAELRFQPFLWVTDLSTPDTVWRVPGLNLPLNIMPLLMGATMIVQMRLTPQPATAEGPQVMMMKIMPWIFTLICYNFAAGLALYSTINGLFTIGQQIAVNKFTKDEPVGISPASIATRTGKALKNVTPGKKK
jgi:YidC/Oxa1 family membrane protein insertase